MLWWWVPSKTSTKPRSPSHDAIIPPRFVLPIPFGGRVQVQYEYAYRSSCSSLRPCLRRKGLFLRYLRQNLVNTGMTHVVVSLQATRIMPSYATKTESKPFFFYLCLQRSFLATGDKTSRREGASIEWPESAQPRSQQPCGHHRMWPS